MSTQLFASAGGGNKTTHKDLVEAKKKLTQIPGYQGVKSGHKVDSFLKRETKTTARNSIISATHTEVQDKLASATQFQTPKLIKGSHDQEKLLGSRNTKTDGFATDLNKLLNNASQTSLEKQIMLR